MVDNLKFAGIYRAKVLDNDDPDKLGRIKVEIYPVLIGEETARSLDGVEGIAVDNLPWAVPAMPLFVGAGEGFGGFAIPEEDSFVFIFFEGGDVYQPVYFAEAQTGTKGLPPDRITNYPNRKIFQTKNGIVIYLDDTEDEEEIKVLHPRGTFIRIDKDGSISATTVDEGNEEDDIIELVHSTGALIRIDKDGNINVDTSTVENADVNITAKEDANITAEGNVNISGTIVNINP